MTQKRGARNTLRQAGAAEAQGDPWTAVALCRELLETDPDDADACDLLGRSLTATGQVPEAVRVLSRAVQRGSGRAMHHLHLGEALTQAGRLQEAVGTLRRALEIDPQSAEGFHALGVALWGLGRLGEARAQFERAVGLDPGFALARRNLRVIGGRMVDRWHFAMVNDRLRNERYEQALRRAVREDTLVLDIGAGAGLLSLLAARAGARHVVACEANPWLAELAREVIAANGYAERVTVIPKPSQQLDPARDFPGGARPSLLVTEIFDAVVIGEGALDTLEHARRHLLAPDATIIPARAALHGCLIESERVWQEGGVGQASGFDLSALNRFHPDTVGLESAHVDGRRLSDDFLIFPFDFSGREQPTPPRQRLRVAVRAAGTLHGVACWIRLDLDGESSLHNRPTFAQGGEDAACRHWYPVVKLLAAPLAVEEGMTLRVEAVHNRRGVALVVHDPVSGKPLD